MEEAYGKKLVTAEMARLQVAMMTMLKMEETDSREKNNEIKHLQHDLQQVQVRTQFFAHNNQCNYACAYLSLPVTTERQRQAADGSRGEGYSTSAEG